MFSNINTTFKSIISLLVVLFGVGTVGLLFLDSFAYPGYVFKKISVNPVDILVAFTIFLGIVQIVFSLKLKQSIYRWLAIVVSPVVSLFALGIHIINELWYPNFSFSVFHLHSEPFKLVAVFFFVCFLLFFDYQALYKKWELPFFTFLLTFIPNLAFFKWGYEDELFWYMKKEDSIIEYMTAIAFFLMTLYAVKSFKKIKMIDLRPVQKKLLLIFFGLMIVGSFLIGAEEISWGQRILGIETPESIAKHNTQEEITIHNNVVVIEYVYWAYLFLSLYCCSAWIVVALLKRFLSPTMHAWMKILTPEWYLSLYFVPEIIYVLGRFEYEYPIVGTWEETSELILSLGLLFFVIDLYRRLPSLTTPFKSKNQ